MVGMLVYVTHQIARLGRTVLRIRHWHLIGVFGERYEKNSTKKKDTPVAGTLVRYGYQYLVGPKYWDV